MRLPLSLGLLLSLSLSTFAAASADTYQATTVSVESPQVQALNAWKAHLKKIGWPAELRDRLAPKLLGKLSKVDDDGKGGKTYTFDGSKPGMLATVTLKLDASGKAASAPVVTFADVVEAR